eukprot:1194153-Prorocentrum_minimum.AAC.1
MTAILNSKKSEIVNKKYKAWSRICYSDSQTEELYNLMYGFWWNTVSIKNYNNSLIKEKNVKGQRQKKNITFSGTVPACFKLGSVSLVHHLSVPDRWTPQYTLFRASRSAHHPPRTIYCTPHTVTVHRRSRADFAQGLTHGGGWSAGNPRIAVAPPSGSGDAHDDEHQSGDGGAEAGDEGGL